MNIIEMFARHYFSLGLNVTRSSNIINIHNFYNRNLLKTPDISFKQWFTERQSETEFSSINWNDATGVGTTSGYNNLVVLDIDGTTDFDVLDDVLDCLCLPKNYEWVTISGSKNGFHIIIFADRFLTTTSDDVVTTFKPNEYYKHKFEKLEFLWKTNAVLPPSLHTTGNKYEFLYCQVPVNQPQKVHRTFVQRLVQSYLDSKCTQGHDDYTSTDFQVVTPRMPKDIDGFDVTKAFDNEFYCIIDIETDGLIEKKNGQNLYPNVVQIAWLIMGKSGTMYKKYSSLLLGDFDYTKNSFKINNIEKNVVDAIGSKPFDVLKLLLSDLKISKCAVFHNSDFDLPILQNALSVNNLPNAFSEKQIICTMKSSTDFCGIDNGYGNYKFPKLTELYSSLFGYEVIQQHNAESDVLITAKCFRQLLNYEIVNII